MNTAELIQFLEGPEEEMPSLFGGASNGITRDSKWGNLLGHLQGAHDSPEVFRQEGWPILDLSLQLGSGPAAMTSSPGPAPMTSSSGPESPWQMVDIMQRQHDSAFPPAVHPAENIAKPPLLRPSDWIAIREGKLDVTNMMEKGKSVMVDEVDNKGALQMKKTPPMSSLGDRFRKELRALPYIVVPHSRRKSTTKAREAKKQIASGDTKLDLNSVPHVGTSSVTNGQKNDEVVVTGEEGAEEQQIVVQNADFHDFDKERTEAQVKKNQIWALYDEKHSMPRFYCQINKVVRYPFHVKGVWLEPLHPQTWLKERELSNGTGRFKLGQPLRAGDTSIHMFSHLMESAKKKSRFFEVYPKWGEVWAIYTDYEKDTERKPKLRYEYVVIRSDFSAMTGEGRVAKLHKLIGYNTLWTPDRESFQMTVKYDLHKFSHLVPALPVTEKDVPGLPGDCLELDPASTPTE